MIPISYSVRKSNSSDLSAVTELLQASYPALMKAAYDPGILGPALTVMTRANPALVSSGTYYVAETENGTLVGCGGWTRERPGDDVVSEGIGHIRHFATHPERTRSGIGSSIYRLCEADAREAGVRRFECYSSVNAEGFYSSLGFERIAVIDLQLIPGVSLTGYRMCREL
jgi:N-acetylglutamate synthase-like GNAT family acetyltransferase